MKNLIGKEMEYRELDNMMVANGYFSTFNDEIAEDIKAEGRICYTSVETDMVEAVVEIEITDDFGGNDFSFKVKAIEMEV